jgi:hypothetical protein
MHHPTWATTDGAHTNDDHRCATKWTPVPHHRRGRFMMEDDLRGGLACRLLPTLGPCATPEGGVDGTEDRPEARSPRTGNRT